MKIGDRVKTEQPPLTGTIIGPCWINMDDCWRIRWDHKIGDEVQEWDEKELNLTVIEPTT